ncbi:hypothetical protein ACQRWP_12160 [Micromonospora trifolii]|uniref:hypothetical protein n=1 Tax=Micromonospora trifolii TaxID=2911208 RepID=UPI003D2EB55A
MTLEKSHSHVHKEPPRSRSAGRPALAIVIGLATGAAMAAVVYTYGLGRTSPLGEGSIPIAVLVGLMVTAGTAWTMFRKGW